MMMQQGPSRPSPHNGSKAAVSFLLRLCALMLAVSSAVVMAASSQCIPSSGAATFTYTRFGAFVFFVVGSITATILEAAALYLQVFLDITAVNKTATEKEQEEKQGIGAAGTVLLVLDLFVPVLIFSAMGAAYVAGKIYGDQIGDCTLFAGQVERAKIISLAACFAATVVVFFRPRPK